jgi:hypothetical protein
MPELSLEERIEMTEAIRDSHKHGRPQDAQRLRQALDAGVYAELIGSGEAPIPEPLPDSPPRRGRGSGTDNWVEYAKLISQIDHEVIETAQKDDIIGMLEANGLLEKLPPPDAVDDQDN